MISITTVPETNIAAENQWLEDYPFLLGVGLFVRGELSVLGKVFHFHLQAAGLIVSYSQANVLDEHAADLMRLMPLIEILGCTAAVKSASCFSYSLYRFHGKNGRNSWTIQIQQYFNVMIEVALTLLTSGGRG